MRSILVPLLALGLAACAAPAPGAAPVPVPPPGQAAASAAPAPRLFTWRAENLVESRRRLASGDPALRPALDALLRDARVALEVPPQSVMQKRRVPPSGDKHDYMSLGPYWWPDSTKPGGLPFIRRDGVVNPENRLDTDWARLGRMQDAVEVLALAWWFTGDTTYASRAARLLRAWYLDPATRMNPNLRYAQSIPGVSEGRGIGIIDTRGFANVIDAVGLLASAPSWTGADQRGLEAWMREYLRWLTTSRQGLEERDARNNHGTWYDAQVGAIALFVGDSAEARRIATERAPRRLDAQVADDGRLPEELVRTRPMHYTFFTLEPFSRIAEQARHVGVDLWRYRGAGGRGLERAFGFAVPWYNRAAEWPGQQVNQLVREEFLGTLRRAAQEYPGLGIASAIAALPDSVRRTHRSLLLYPGAAAGAGSAAATAGQGSASLDTLVERTLRYAASQLRRTADSLDPAQGWPRYTGADGRWIVTPAANWTAGFFPGTLWQMYAATRDPWWRAAAARWTAGLEPNAKRTNTHDLGFIIFDSFGRQHRLTGDAHAREVVLEASRSLVTRYNPTVGAIKSWDTEGARDHRASWKYPVIIDNLMNLEMLFWAARHGGDPAWAQLAERHALTSARAHVRPDGSTAHVALFDPATGGFEGQVTWQGASDGSTWARGQAWAIHGFTESARATGNPALLEAARRTADWFVAHLPADGVPYWDFSVAGRPGEPRDASAGAIAASGLLALSGLVAPEDAVRYRMAASRMLTTLCTDFVSRPNESWAILSHATGGKPQGVEIDVGISYGDFYFVEALRRWQAMSRKADG
ncbi:MAG TPA: alginate lyase family protein [Gemmatimonadaceae bacterium]